MTHIHGERDAGLHDEVTGEHIGTARTANGRDLERHEARIRGHLAAHADADGDPDRAAQLRQVRR